MGRCASGIPSVSMGNMGKYGRLSIRAGRAGDVANARNGCGKLDPRAESVFSKILNNTFDDDQDILSRTTSSCHCSSTLTSARARP
eukprot:3615282-Prymnesium_polylepis.1